MDLADPTLLQSDAWIDGASVKSRSGAVLEVRNPANGRRLGTVPDLGAEETREAVYAAARALPGWRARTAAERARVLCGGRPHALGGTFFEPTVVAGVSDDSAIASEAGLAAYVYTRDLGRARRVSAALEAGMVGVNEGIVSTEVAPFGGVKQSGLGREGSRHGLDEYLELEYVLMGGLGGGE